VRGLAGATMGGQGTAGTRAGGCAPEARETAWMAVLGGSRCALVALVVAQQETQAVVYSQHQQRDGEQHGDGGPAGGSGPGATGALAG